MSSNGDKFVGTKCFVSKKERGGKRPRRSKCCLNEGRPEEGRRPGGWRPQKSFQRRTWNPGGDFCLVYNMHTVGPSSLPSPSSSSLRPTTKISLSCWCGEAEFVYFCLCYSVWCCRKEMTNTEAFEIRGFHEDWAHQHHVHTGNPPNSCSFHPFPFLFPPSSPSPISRLLGPCGGSGGGQEGSF